MKTLTVIDCQHAWLYVCPADSVNNISLCISAIGSCWLVDCLDSQQTYLFVCVSFWISVSFKRLYFYLRQNSLQCTRNLGDLHCITYKMFQSLLQFWLLINILYNALWRKLYGNPCSMVKFVWWWQWLNV